MKKNEEYIVDIEDVSDEGNGIGHINDDKFTSGARGMAVFVKDTAPGDKARIVITKVMNHYAYGRAIEILEPSPDRIVPPCPVAKQCGGCTLQHLSYEAQLKLKRDKVVNCLQRIGGIENASELVSNITGSSPLRYRNKMQFPVGLNQKGEITFGFYAGRTHNIIPVEDCLIGHPVNQYLLAAVKTYMQECHVAPYNEETGRGIVRHVLTRIGFHTGELMVCIVANAGELPRKEKLTELLSGAVSKYRKECKTESNFESISIKSVVLNMNKEKTNRILGRETITLWGSDKIVDYIGNVKFEISAQSFFQVNPEQTERLYAKAIEYAGLTGGETVWDMYCGIGTISLFLAKKAGKVYGVELVPEAIEDAKKNAKLNDITNAEFYVGKAEDVVTNIYKENRPGSKADIVVVDPPRKGCDEKLLETIVQMAPKKLVYVSCGPATLARDVKYLREHGFQLEKAEAFDQFGQSTHVETVCFLTKH